MTESDSSYAENIEWLFNQFPAFQKVGQVAYKPTLENTRNLIARFHVQLEELNFVHIAGTNGKGTTASIMASTFIESGLKTGLFTSPHIHDFRERIRVNGKLIPEQKVNQFINAVKHQDFDIAPSFFEISWVLALRHFQDEKCDIVVVETGLGGRLDATNVITPLISVITNIGLDHTAILGETLGGIAMEKAGIIKKEVPVVIGQLSKETSPVFKDFALRNNAPIYFVEHQTDATTFDINKQNAKTALELLTFDSYQFDPTAFQTAIAKLTENTGFQGRFQVLGKDPLIIADAAHNLDGISRLIQDIERLYPEKNIRVVYGAANDKALEPILSLFPDSWEVNFTAFENKRSYTIESFQHYSTSFSFKCNFFKKSSEALSYVQSTINKDDVILIFGSFFLLEEII